MNDREFMAQALALARQAEQEGEVPVGALLVKDGNILGAGYNCPISQHDPSAHAEMQAIRQAAQKIGNYRLTDTTLYVTLEPCAMCAGLLVHSRIKRLVFGASDPKSGACGGALNVIGDPAMNHQVEVTAGVMADECGALLSEFFRNKRALKKQLKQKD